MFCCFALAVSCYFYNSIVILGFCLVFSCHIPSFLSFRFSHMASWDCCASILFTYTKTSSLVALHMSFEIDNSLIIFPVKMWPLMPFMNVSFNLLSTFFYLYSVVLLPVYHSSADSSEFLFNLQYCKIVLLNFVRT